MPDHGGQPAPPNNPGIDGTNLTFFNAIPPIFPDSFVIPLTSNFDVAMEFTLSPDIVGSVALALVGTATFNYTVTYTFAGLGVPNVVLATGSLATIPNQLVYGAPNTAVTVVQNGSGGPKLPVGTYEVLATVSFAPNFPFAAYFEFPVLDIVA